MRVKFENPDPRCNLPKKAKACASWVRHVKGNPAYKSMSDYCVNCEWWEDYPDIAEYSPMDDYPF